MTFPMPYVTPPLFSGFRSASLAIVATSGGPQNRYWTSGWMDIPGQYRGSIDSQPLVFNRTIIRGILVYGSLLPIGNTFAPQWYKVFSESPLPANTKFRTPLNGRVFDTGTGGRGSEYGFYRTQIDTNNVNSVPWRGDSGGVVTVEDAS